MDKASMEKCRKLGRNGDRFFSVVWGYCTRACPAQEKRTFQLSQWTMWSQFLIYIPMATIWMNEKENKYMIWSKSVFASDVYGQRHKETVIKRSILTWFPKKIGLKCQNTFCHMSVQYYITVYSFISLKLVSIYLHHSEYKNEGTQAYVHGRCQLQPSFLSEHRLPSIHMLLLHCLSRKGWVELSIKALLHLVNMTGLSSWASTAFTISRHWHTTLWQLVLPLKGLSRHDPSMPQSSSPLPPSNCGTTGKNNMLWEHLSPQVRWMMGLNSNVCICQIWAHKTLRFCAQSFTETQFKLQFLLQEKKWLFVWLMAWTV